jgi:hypothetical protein
MSDWLQESTAARHWEGKTLPREYATCHLVAIEHRALAEKIYVGIPPAVQAG